MQIANFSVNYFIGGSIDRTEHSAEFCLLEKHLCCILLLQACCVGVEERLEAASHLIPDRLYGRLCSRGAWAVGHRRAVLLTCLLNPSVRHCTGGQDLRAPAKTLQLSAFKLHLHQSGTAALLSCSGAVLHFRVGLLRLIIRPLRRLCGRAARGRRLGLAYGEKTYPGAYIRINAMRVNGEEIAFEKGYTSSDNGVETRMNVYNEWVSEVPADARSFDGKVDDVKPVIVDKELFAAVKSFEIDFSLLPVTDVAYLMYADSAWANQFWYDGNEYPGKVTTAEIAGPGTYTVGIELDEEAQGLAFAAVGIANGEKTFNGYFIDVTEIKVNGEPITIGKGYTSSDNGIETRENIYNEWVSELPADARRADGSLEGAAPVIVDKEAFAAFKSIEVTFNFIYGKPIAKDEEAPLTQEEADALKQSGFNAYIGVQGKDTYVFRNSWEEASYGLANPEFFNRLTGWDADNNAVDYGGTFVDAEIKGDGEYTVSFTTGDMGMGTTADYNMLFVSTNIPSKLVKDGFLTIDNVKVKFGSGATQEYTEVDTTGEYAAIKIIDTYNQAAAPAITWTVPGANETVAITFTVSGW